MPTIKRYTKEDLIEISDSIIHFKIPGTDWGIMQERDGAKKITLLKENKVVSRWLPLSYQAENSWSNNYANIFAMGQFRQQVRCYNCEKYMLLVLSAAGDIYCIQDITKFDPTSDINHLSHTWCTVRVEEFAVNNF